MTRIPPPRGLGVDGAVHFAEIDLSATGPHHDEGTGFTDRYVSTFSFELRGALDVARADVSATGAELGIAGDVANHDVTAGGVCVQVAGHVEHFDMSALGFQLGHGTIAKARTGFHEGSMRPVVMLPPSVCSSARPPMSEVWMSPAPVEISTL